MPDLLSNLGISQALKSLEGIVPSPAVLERSAIAFVAAIKETLSRPGGGPATKRYNPNRTVRPSIPGAPPAVDRGDLRRSVLYGRIEENGEVVMRVGLTAPHAAPLDRGAPSRGLAPRPFMEPALALAQPNMEPAIVEAIRRELENKPEPPSEEGAGNG